MHTAPQHRTMLDGKQARAVQVWQEPGGRGWKLPAYYNICSTYQEEFMSLEEIEQSNLQVRKYNCIASATALCNVSARQAQQVSRIACCNKYVRLHRAPRAAVVARCCRTLLCQRCLKRLNLRALCASNFTKYCNTS